MNAYLWFDLKCVHDGIKEMKFLFAFQFLIFIFEVNNIEGSKILMVTKLFLKEFYCIYFTIFNWISTCIKWLRMQCIRIFILIYIKIFTISIWMCVCAYFVLEWINGWWGISMFEVWWCWCTMQFSANLWFKSRHKINIDIVKPMLLYFSSVSHSQFLVFLIVCEKSRIETISRPRQYFRKMRHFLFFFFFFG